MDGVKVVLEKMKDKFTLIKKMWVDMGYQGQELKSDVKRMHGIDLEVVKRLPCSFWVPL
jgi:putative transposase